MVTGIITGWVILFGVVFVCKVNRIFELNTTQEENPHRCYGYGAIERQENEAGTTIHNKSQYQEMLKRTFLMCF